jgi:hypothetical protein
MKFARLQRKVTAVAQGLTTAPPVVHAVLRTAGVQLPAATCANMEARMGHNFSAVRIHADALAAQSAAAVSAEAWTVGRDIAFAAGRYAPGTFAGDQLLAHELTHVVQQGGQPYQGQAIEIGQPTDSVEQHAEHVAAGAASAMHIPRVAPSLQRQPQGERPQADPAIASLPFSKYVDLADPIVYDIDYNNTEHTLSPYLQLYYEDGTKIDLDIYKDIGNVELTYD